MSEQAARSALSRMNLREQFIAPHYTDFASDLTRMMSTNPEEAKERFLSEGRHELCEAYGFTRRDQSKPFAFADGVAFIPVHGTLINRFGSSYGFVTGYNFIRQQHNAALLDPDVTHIIHDHNSYGGEAAGCFELADQIAASRGTKPIIAVVDSNCYSASYALASAADRIAVVPSAGVGSVGVVAMHVDMSTFLDKMGVKITFIHSGEHKVDGNPYEALSADVKANIQQGVDKSRAKFVSLVARNLGLEDKLVYDTEARTYRAEDALALGLIHAIVDPVQGMQSIIESGDSEESDEAANTTTTKEQIVTNPATTAPAATATPAAAAAPAIDQGAIQKAERERVGGILNCEEAKGRTALANHLAMNTSMSIDDAKATLAAAPGAAEPAATVTPPAAANQFAHAMANTQHPNVGADGTLAAGAPGAPEEDAAASILSSYGSMTGRQFGK